jgi:hypothetical protein
MESLGAVSFIIAFLFFCQRQRISYKQKAFLEALKTRVISERGDGKCYSSEWIMDNIVYKTKKLLNATPLLIASIALLGAVLYYVILPRIFFSILNLGYVFVIALIGVLILLETDAFQAYSYTSAIHKVSTEQLDKEDQSYIELAREALEKAFLRFFSLGVAFALTGPFIPQIFNGIVNGFMWYTAVFFQASEVSAKISTIFGILIVLTLPALMLFLPEVLGRVIIRKGKSLVRKMLRRGVER